MLLRKVPAVYPQVALRHHLQGAVNLKILVNEAGRVTKVEIIDGPPDLRRAAVEAVSRWIYRPASLDGKPVSASVKVELMFHATN